MSFVDFFRPKWKHSDPDVRAEAVRDLDIQSQLAQVLRTDEDPRVRKIALKKVGDPDLLSEVAESDADEGLRRAAAEKASEIFLGRAIAGTDSAGGLTALKRLGHPRAIAEVAKSSALDEVRRAALARLSDDKNLVDVAKNAKDPATRKAAVERIHDSQALRDIAIVETVKEVALAAIEAIHETSVLEQVAKRARNKQVAQAARDRLPQAMGRIERSTRGQQEASPDARRRARQAQLTRKLEHAIGITELAAAEHAVAHVKREWATLGDHGADDEGQKKFDKVLERFAIRKRTLEEAHRAQVGAHAESEAAQHRRTAEEKSQADVREALCARVEALDGEPPAVKAAVEAARTEWQEMPRLVGPKGKELEIRFRKATEAAVRRAELALSKGQLHERLAAVVAEAEALAGPLKEVEPKVRALRKRLGDLEAAGFDDELRARFRKVEERVEGEKAEQATRRASEEAEAQKRLEDLVARLEAIGEAERKKIDHELKVAASAFESTRLRGPALHALRNRYAAIRDKLAARAQELRDAENWKRWANVPQLEKLCERMEAIARAIAAEQHPVAPAQPAAAVDEPSAASAEGSVTSAEGSATSHEGSATSHEGSGIDQDASSASQPVAAPPAGALPLLGKDSKVDFKRAMAEMKSLQAEWRTVGPAPKERSEQLWQRFKIAGDEVYHRTHTGFEKLGESRAENLKKKEELCVQVEALVQPFAAARAPAGETPDVEGAAAPPASAAWKETAEKVKALQEEWKRVGPVDKKDTDAIWKRFRGACDQFFGKRKEAGGRASEARGESIKKMEELCLRVEALVDSPDFKKAANEIKAAQAEWKTVGPAPRGESDRLWKRFRGACDTFFNRRTTQFAEQDAERMGNLKRKEELCVAAEALVEQALAGDREQAMRDAKRLQADWKKAGPAPREHGDAIWRRFRAACDKVFQAPDEAPPEAAAAAPSPESDPKNWPKFENKLPLAGVLAQLQGAAAPPADDKQGEPGGGASEPKPTT